MSGAPKRPDVRATPPESDPFLLALARYVQALDQRYPAGLEQMRSETLATRANMRVVRTTEGADR